MKNKPLYFFVLLMACLIAQGSFAYEVYEGKSTVSPGCSGGVLYTKTESWFSTMPEDVDSNASEYSHELNHADFE